MLLPSGRREWLIFGGFALLYLSYSIVLGLYASITGDKRYWVDIYFSFDVSSFMHPDIWPGVFSRHPMLPYFMAPFYFFGDLLVLWFDSYKAKSLFFIVLCNLLISASVVYIYRYLRTIISLKGLALYIPVFFYAFASTNLILCFTPESFTISAFLLTFTVYYYSYALKNNIPVRLASNLSFVLLLGGTTITNFVKGIIPVFFTEKKIRSFMWKSLIVSSIFAVILLQGIMRERNVSTRSPVEHYQEFSDVPSRYQAYVCQFFGTPVFLPEITINDTLNLLDVYPENAINTTFYTYWWQYAFIGVLYLLIIISTIVNLKNKWVQMLLLLFSMDIFIHVIACFGLTDDTFVYGGHWVYCLPLLLGWLFYYASDKKILKTSLLVVTSVLLAGLVVNNLIRLSEFIHLALTYWGC